MAVAATAAAAPTRSPVPRAIEAAPNAPFALGEAIVRFEPGTGTADRRSARSAAGVGFERGIAIPRAQVVAVDGAVKAAIQRLERQPDIAYAQPNYRYEALAVDAPNDTFFDDLWGLSDFATPDRGVDALAAWEATKGAGQVIAVVDTGVDLRHPDLEANLWTNPGETADDETDGDGNEKDGDLHGYDFVDLDGDPDDYHDHGTHVAGTAAAVEGNELGIAGVVPDAQIMAVRVLDGNGSGSTADIAAGIRYAAEEGADVINLSLGGPAGDGDQAMADEVAVARTEGAVVVAAAGNEGVDNDVEPHSPCVLPEPTDGQPLDNLICVAATDRDGNLAVFSSSTGSNWGATTVHVGAPGVGALSAVPSYAPIFEEGFEDGLDGWTVATLNGAEPWGLVSSPNSDGAPSVADSPDGDYANATDPDFFAESRLVMDSGLDLSGERGCKVRFDVRHDLERQQDFLEAGAVTSDGIESLVATYHTGSSGGSFRRGESSISGHDGQHSVHPWFTLLSDGSITDDGAYVDRLRVLCRVEVDGTDAEYRSFSGTSMAAPHVAGVVALARAAAIDAGTDAGAQAIVDAVLAGVNPLDDLDGTTVTGGMVDACLAIGEARGTAGDCSDASSEPDPDGDGDGGDSEEDTGTGDGGTTDDGDGSGETGTSPDDGTDDGGTDTGTPAGGGSTTTEDPTGEPALAPLARPNLRRSPRRVRARRSGRFAYAFLAPRGVRGAIALRTARRVRVHPLRRARRHVRIAFRRFAVRDRRRVVLRFRLSPRERRILRLNRHLRLRVTVKVRDTTGQAATARKRLVLVAPRIRRR